jgi:predicted GNAT family acetyltransferase
MDTDQLIAHGRARFEHAAARRLLKERFKAKMIFAYAGGMWQAGPELLAVLSVIHTPETVILDMYETPVRVDTKVLTDLVQERWQEQMNAWLVAYNDMSQQR